ncbi:hypothetical protein N7474_003024 [Penicillium riverlandense]|uniref:uncharacterized protein n=1 Tax=Penicillium riverlandense TaxID=1903569 RepID=UPI002546C136|nr:uncharacterized protein N7474_003024 [Penicillium riverlandense]KAJ5825886.1 hypothetical protein N7474_003024 [Penicillium riverlandense]
MTSTFDPQGVATQVSIQGFIGITWAGAALGIVFAAIRIAIRLKLAKRLMVDDYFVLLALAFFVTNAILQTLQAPHLYYMILDMTGPDIVYHGEHYTYYEFAIIAKSRTIAVRLISMAMTGYYRTMIRPRVHRPLSMLKYDPVVKKKVLFLEATKGGKAK